MSTEFTDYYSTLGIGFEASGVEIKTAYRKLAREYHPDLHTEDAAFYTQKFREITEAYETLSNPLKKGNYDFLYREYVLQEQPQYEYYYEDTPVNTTDYKHTYTKRSKFKIAYFPLIILFFLSFQLLKWASDIPPITPAEMRIRSYQTEELIKYIQDSARKGDTASYFPSEKK